MSILLKYLQDAEPKPLSEMATEPTEQSQEQPTEPTEKPLISYALSGELQATSGDWVLLSVPNALVRGLFDAMSETGIELPPRSGGEDGLKAHISVIRPEELAIIGGADKLSERGHHFHYTLGPLRTTVPAGWDAMSRVWFVEVRSPELEKLRKSYGLSALPNEGKFGFHISIAVRRKNVLKPGNEVTKISTDVSGMPEPYWQRAMNSQLASPSWTPGTGVVQNIGNNIQEAHSHGQRMIGEAFMAQRLRDTMNGTVSPSQLGDTLSGHTAGPVVGQADQLLFRP